MKSKVRLLTVLALMFAGIGVMAYPPMSQYLNAIHASRAVQEYAARLDAVDSEVLEQQRLLAEEYNQALSGGLSASDILEQYDRILDFGNGIMGYLCIPDIGVELSIYHGVSDTVLQKGVGHMPSSALPIGGAGTHCVLTGHTGLPSAALFTELTELTEGDRFSLHVLSQVLEYEVDQITVVLPHEVELLGPVQGRDFCTLVTCTPYGINSHRLLVRGRRVHTQPEATIRQEVSQPETAPAIPVALILAGSAMLLLLSAGVLVLLRADKEERP